MIDRFDFDSGLAALPLAFEAEVVVGLFSAAWPTHPAPAITLGRRQSVDYRPGLTCSVTYSLTITPADGAPQASLGVVTVTPGGITARLFPTDPQLPGLALAADPEWARQRLGVAQCVVSPVRYKPGERCVLRYQTISLTDEQTFYAKVSRQAGAAGWTTLCALQRAGLATPTPLAYWPEAQAFLQGQVCQGRELQPCLFDPTKAEGERLALARRAGEALGALHNGHVAAPQHSWEAELRDLRAYRPPIDAIAPELGQQYLTALDALAAAGGQHREPALAPGHGAFRTDQMMIDAAGRLVFLDLDGYCWANPARDLGNALAYWAWKAIRQPEHAAFIQSARRALLGGYAATRSLPSAEWLALYEAAALLKILGRRYRGLTVSEWPQIPRLLQTALARMGLAAPAIESRAA